LTGVLYVLRRSEDRLENRKADGFGQARMNNRKPAGLQAGQDVTQSQAGRDSNDKAQYEGRPGVSYFNSYQARAMGGLV
jgi:hypothetical protein